MTNCDPATLLSEAKCFLCLDRKSLDAEQAYLLCLKAGGTPPPSTSNYLTNENGDYILDQDGNKIVVQI